MVRPPKQAVADEIWGLVAGLMVERRDAALALAESVGLTPGDMKALLSFEDDPPPSMRTLAEGWDCDASHVTWLIDRLEQAGWVERRNDPNDRRVRTAVLTPSGRKMRDELRAAFTDPPAALQRLSIDQLTALAELLHRTGVEARAPQDIMRGGRHRHQPPASC